MKSKYLLPLGVVLSSLFTAVNSLLAQGTAFTYTGRLNNNGAPANGAYDLRFTLYDASAGGNVVAGPLPVSPVDVANGLFTVKIDFGAGIFTGPALWLNIEVQPPGGGGFTPLSPRHEVTSSPYAIRAQTAGTAADVNLGTVVKSLNGLRDDLTLAAGANVTITPNGNTLTLAAAGVGGAGIWSVLNNNAYYNAGNVGIGTSTPAHRLSLSGGPSWTANGWVGALELPNGSALAWQANTAGQRFGMGHANTGFYLFRTASNPGTTGSPALYDFVVDDSGNVGIGTTAPTAGIRLEVTGATLLKPGNGNIQFGSPNAELGMSIIPTAATSRADLRFNGSTLKLLAAAGVGPPPAENGIVISTSGNVGIGSPSPTAKLEVVAQNALSLIGYQPFLTLSDANAGYARARIQCAGGEMILFSESYLNGNDGNAYAKLFNTGNFSVKTLTIRGGADLAEPFELSGADIAKGSVVIIDDENPGKLKLSSRAYDTRVAGIVSGANGVNPGISLHQDGALEGGQNVALSGRVYVLAEASHGMIRPGDLLTTSDTPGHAMKVTDHAKGQGAILGKAMSTLKEGRGMVLVLVTLQ